MQGADRGPPGPQPKTSKARLERSATRRRSIVVLPLAVSAGALRQSHAGRGILYFWLNNLKILIDPSKQGVPIFYGDLPCRKRAEPGQTSAMNPMTLRRLARRGLLNRRGERLDSNNLRTASGQCP